MSRNDGGWRGRTVISTLTVVATVAVLASCSPAATSTGAPLPVAAPVVVVTMREYGFEYDNNAIPSGRVMFRFVNEGKIFHRPAIIALTEDTPPIDEQIRGEQRRPVTPVAKVYNRLPGVTGVFAVDLIPGQRYAILCYARDEGTEDSHALKGMTSEFRAI